VADSLGGPLGLGAALVAGAASVPVRFWVVDNSGSMAAPDGARLVQDGRGSYRRVAATRWEELRETVLAQARLASALRARLDIHLLNPPRGGRQFLSLDGAGGGSGGLPAAGPPSSLRDLEAALASGPSGSTPLTEAVVTIQSLLEGAAPQMAATGAAAVVVLATDGLPNDPDGFVRALQSLQALRCVWVVVRLCTDSPEVLEYWNGLDGQLEAPLEVLDDAAAEAAEVQAVNRWLTYGLPLHSARESGLRHKLFDLLDEAPFIGSQIAEMASLLLGLEPPLPNPDADWLGFQARLGVALATTAPTYCPLANAPLPWVDLPALRSRFGGSVRRSWFSPAEDGRLAASAELSGPPRHSGAGGLRVSFSAAHLHWPTWFTKPAPFLAVSAAAGNGRLCLLGHTAALPGAREPAWAPLYLRDADLRRWDAGARLRLHVLNFEADHAHRVLGWIDTSAGDLAAGALTKGAALVGPDGRATRGRLTAVAEPLR